MLGKHVLSDPVVIFVLFIIARSSGLIAYLGADCHSDDLCCDYYPWKEYSYSLLRLFSSQVCVGIGNPDLSCY